MSIQAIGLVEVTVSKVTRSYLLKCQCYFSIFVIKFGAALDYIYRFIMIYLLWFVVAVIFMVCSTCSPMRCLDHTAEVPTWHRWPTTMGPWFGLCRPQLRWELERRAPHALVARMVIKQFLHVSFQRTPLKTCKNCQIPVPCYDTSRYIKKIQTESDPFSSFSKDRFISFWSKWSSWTPM